MNRRQEKKKGNYLRYLWAMPTTCLGLVFVPLALATGGRLSVVQGVLEIHGGIVRWFLTHMIPIRGGAEAMTLGHVILGRTTQSLQRCRVHEQVHVRQVEKWGILFVPVYLLAGLTALLRGQDPYRDNCFEQEAFHATKRSRSL